MGIGNSHRRDRPKLKKGYPSNYHGHHGGGAGRQRGLLRKMKLDPTTQNIVPVKRHPPWRYSYGSNMWRTPMPAYSIPQSVLPMSMPMAYNNNYAAAYPYAPRSQPMMGPSPQPAIPIIAPPPVPQYGPMVMSQLPPMSAPYSTGLALSPSYIQQAPSARPAYNNNMEYSTPMPTGSGDPMASYGTPTMAKTGYFLTDWTGGGKLSPGFLGPPL